MSTEELRKDVEELRALIEQATRQRVKDILSIEVRKLETEIMHRDERQSKQAMETDATEVKSSVPVPSRTDVKYTVKISTYAWDQSDKFMKIYADLAGVDKIPKEAVSCEFTARSFKLNVNDLGDKNYELFVSNLMEKIVPSESFFKIKSDMVLVMLKKEELKKTWAFVTEREKKAKETKKPNLDKDKDPQESMMDLLKQMYDEGDDEMKRSIAKSWYEGRNKQGKDDY